MYTPPLEYALEHWAMFCLSSSLCWAKCYGASLEGFLCAHQRDECAIEVTPFSRRELRAYESTPHADTLTTSWASWTDPRFDRLWFTVT